MMPNLEELLARIEAIEKRQERILRALWKLRGDHKSVVAHLENELGAEYVLMQKDTEKVTNLPFSPTETYTVR